MKKKNRIVYLFSDINGNTGFNKQVEKYLKKDILDNNKITFISANPCNKKESERKVEHIINYFYKIGIKFNNVELLLEEDQEEIIKNKLGNTSVLFLLGGNPLEQMEFINRKDINDFIDEFEGIVVGESAGSMNLSKKVLMLSVNKDYPKTVIYDGLGLVPFSFFPHFNINSLEDEMVDMGYDQKFKMNDLKIASKNCKELYCLPNDSSIRFINYDFKILDKNLYVLYNNEFKLKKSNK